MSAGVDNTVTGIQTAGDAKSHPTTGGQLLQKTGLSPGAAEWTWAGFQLGTGYAGIRVGNAYGVFSLPPQTDAFTKAAITEGNFYKDGSIVDIAGHFEKFEDGASLLAPADVIGKYPVVGRQDGLFVSSPDYISKLLKKTGGNNDLIKKELGIEPQYWSGPLVRVDISNPLQQAPRLPSGLEGGQTRFSFEEALHLPALQK